MRVSYSICSVGVELSADYCAMIARRLEQQSLFANT